MRSFIILLLALTLFGCAHKYRTDSFDSPRQPLSKNAAASVMLAADGSYGAKRYAGSGRAVSSELRSALLRHFQRVEIANVAHELDRALRDAKATGMAYVFQPAILHWEDRATEWSGRPDRITIKVTVWDAVSSQIISSGVLRASSKWGTFGGDHPVDLLPKLLSIFANRLFEQD